MSNSYPTCTTLGHENEPAAGEAYFDEEEPHAWFPYCADCLRRCDPPVRRYSDLQRIDHLVNRIVAALKNHDQELRELHHVRVALDANARQFIAEILTHEFLVALEKETSRDPFGGPVR